MLLCITSPIGSAELIFLHFFIYVHQSNAYTGILDGGIKNTHNDDINELRIYFKKLEDMKVETYRKDHILDEKHERNVLYKKFVSSNNNVIIENYPTMAVKDFSAGLEVAGANQQFFKISLVVPDGILPGENFFFRIKIDAKLPLLEKNYVFLKKKILDLKIYPNAYPESSSFSNLGIEAVDNLINVKEFHAWIILPKNYVFIDTPELPYKFRYINDEFEAIMMREENIQEGRFFKRIQYSGYKTRFIINNLSKILALIAIALSVISIIIAVQK